MEFSKKLTVVSWVVASLLTVLAVILPIHKVPVDGLLVALPLSWGEVTVANGFYFWKAKNDNRHKYAMKYVDQVAQEHGIDSAIRLAEIVLKD